MKHMAPKAKNVAKVGSSVTSKRAPSEENLSLYLKEIKAVGGYSDSEIAQLLGTSYFSLVRWERGHALPGASILKGIKALHRQLKSGQKPEIGKVASSFAFASRGARKVANGLPLFDKTETVDLLARPGSPLLQRLMSPPFWGNGDKVLSGIRRRHSKPATTLKESSVGVISAGKNTYTYDAHTYHTKVPPQGIAEIVKHYLPNGGLVLDPFAGSGMTGVAARTLGLDVILNELSPAASFIADRFTRQIDPSVFSAGVAAVCDAVKTARHDLYSTHCRECRKEVEIQYTVWSYRVLCNSCDQEFVLWDHCRQYGNTVREHKILSEFPCPHCKTVVKKSRLKRTTTVPVLVGYRCCTRAQVERPLSSRDLAKIRSIEKASPAIDGFFPKTPIPDGVNLGQPKRHGLDSIDKFYTARNLAAMSHLWQAIHRVEDKELAGFLGFVFTSLYQRVTRLSEFRFWGGSGNTARFNVPYIFNEANVFVTFERKARSIQDHLQTTARQYQGECVVHTGSATDLKFIPDNSVDLIFTDPPFGANINYSEMNILWESWLGSFTDSKHEAIVNKFQNKDEHRYGDLMQQSLIECRRVLRPGHWLLLVFMNSSQKIWEELRRAIAGAGFNIDRVDIFDKQHGTFKQFVSDNTAGCDLILHCRKEDVRPKDQVSHSEQCGGSDSVEQFLASRIGDVPVLPFLHVDRAKEVDFRMLYSEWLAANLVDRDDLLDFASFRDLVSSKIQDRK